MHYTVPGSVNALKLSNHRKTVIDFLVEQAYYNICHHQMEMNRKGEQTWSGKIYKPTG